MGINLAEVKLPCGRRRPLQVLCHQWEAMDGHRAGNSRNTRHKHSSRSLNRSLPTIDCTKTATMSVLCQINTRVWERSCLQELCLHQLLSNYGLLREALSTVLGHHRLHERHRLLQTLFLPHAEHDLPHLPAATLLHKKSNPTYPLAGHPLGRSLRQPPLPYNR